MFPVQPKTLHPYHTNFQMSKLLWTICSSSGNLVEQGLGVEHIKHNNLVNPIIKYPQNHHSGWYKPSPKDFLVYGSQGFPQKWPFEFVASGSSVIISENQRIRARLFERTAFFDWGRLVVIGKSLMYPLVN